MTTVLITGARGFIARHAARTFTAAGWRVIGASRTAGELPHFDRVYGANLGDPLWSLLTAERVDAVIHTALDTGADSYARNVSGTAKWLAEAKQAGVGLQVFLSSLSADAEALADYGRAKHALEQKFVAAGEMALRLGVVVGAGGMFARMVASATAYPIVPLLDGGAQLVYVIGCDTLTHILRDAVQCGGEGWRGRVWHVQQPQPFTLRQIITAILRHTGQRKLLVPLPARPLVGLLSLFEKQQLIRLPVTSTNVRGLIQGGRREFPSDFAQFGYPVERLDDLIARALAAA